MILRLILEPLIEEDLMQSLIKSGVALLPYVDRPIAGVPGAFTLLLLGPAARVGTRPALAERRA